MSLLVFMNLPTFGRNFTIEEFKKFVKEHNITNINGYGSYSTNMQIGFFKVDLKDIAPPYSIFTHIFWSKYYESTNKN